MDKVVIKHFWYGLMSCALTLSAGAACEDDGVGTEPESNGAVSFGEDVEPVLRTNCRGCHGSAGGLDLSSYESLMAGGDSGPVVVPGSPDESLIIKRIEGEIEPRMPIGKSLEQREIDVVRDWIEQGAEND